MGLFGSIQKSSYPAPPPAPPDPNEMARDNPKLPIIRRAGDVKKGMVFRVVNTLGQLTVGRLKDVRVVDATESDPRMELQWEYLQRQNPDTTFRTTMRYSVFKLLTLQSWVDLSRYPHKCPRCGEAAYVGAGGGAAVDCMNDACPTRKR